MCLCCRQSRWIELLYLGLCNGTCHGAISAPKRVDWHAKPTDESHTHWGLHQMGGVFPHTHISPLVSHFTHTHYCQTKAKISFAKQKRPALLANDIAKLSSFRIGSIVVMDIESIAFFAAHSTLKLWCFWLCGIRQWVEANQGNLFLITKCSPYILQTFAQTSNRAMLTCNIKEVNESMWGG